MIIETADLTTGELLAATGWELKPEGLCRDDRCVPLGDAAPDDASSVAARLGMPLVHDEANGLWAVGPESGGRMLASTRLPEITLPDLDGNPFSLSSLLGQKVLLVAWASW
jgi:hypothetical protein